jgi:hypothetical protein
MIICGNDKQRLALKMLEDINMCNLDHINKKSQSALLLACINNEKNIAMKIITQYPTKCGKLNLVDTEDDKTIFMIMCDNGWYDAIHEMFNITKNTK